MQLERVHIGVFLGIAVISWGFVLLCQGVDLRWQQLQPFGTVVGVLAIAGMGLERSLWHHRWLHGWFVKRPDLRGTWRVELQSDWIDPTTGRSVPEIVCYMGVVQRLSNLQMHLMTSESESFLIAESVKRAPSGVGYQIAGVYTNRPAQHLRGDRSEVHFGSLILDTHGPPNRPEVLAGEYWTDRKTRGRMKLSGRVPEVLTRFEDAELALLSRDAR